MMIDGVEFSRAYLRGEGVVWVPVEWLMRNAYHSCDFGEDFTIAEMVKDKARDTGFGHLVESIMKNGFLEDGPIGFDATDNYITEGHHRFTAAILLCLSEVPVSMWGSNIMSKTDPYSTLVCAHENEDDEYPIEV